MFAPFGWNNTCNYSNGKVQGQYRNSGSNFCPDGAFPRAITNDDLATTGGHQGFVKIKDTIEPVVD